jgi:hypothetical protein
MIVHTRVFAQTTPPSKQWAYHYGGSDVDVAFVIKLTTDGGTIVAGYTDSKDGDIDAHTSSECWDLWVARLPKCGALQWQQSFGGTDYESAKDMVQTLTNQEYVAGRYNIDIYNDGLASGVYFIRLQNKSLQRVINVVKMPL